MRRRPNLYFALVWPDGLISAVIFSDVKGEVEDEEDEEGEEEEEEERR